MRDGSNCTLVNTSPTGNVLQDAGPSGASNQIQVRSQDRQTDSYMPWYVHRIVALPVPIVMKATKLV